MAVATTNLRGGDQPALDRCLHLVSMLANAGHAVYDSVTMANEQYCPSSASNSEDDSVSFRGDDEGATVVGTA
jgi:hypothetical protein